MSRCTTEKISLNVKSDLSRQDIGTSRYSGTTLLLNTIEKYIFSMIIRGFILCFKRFKAISAKVLSPTKRSTLDWPREGV